MDSPSEEFQWFTSETHAQRYRNIFARNFIEEKAWVLKHGELPEVTIMLKKHKLTHLNAQIQPVARDLVLEFYANAYRAPDDEATDSTQLVLWVRSKDLQGTSKRTPSKILVVDLASIPKGWAYYIHHTLDTNWSGSDLTTERALALHFFMKNKPKAGVKDLDGRKMLRPSCCLDPSWLKAKIVVATSEEQIPPWHPHASEAGPSAPPRQDTSHGVLRATPPIENKDSQTHIDRMTQSRFMQDMYAHMGAPECYLMHQSDTWADSQRFRDRLLGESSAPYYGLYRYPGMETSI
ncbi:hypothetical protein KIW84_035937 [Lathyrus oleraceus]|uniref:Uncharacterized protein n=1 Tax=Pisum sativum TaxID=3888 RepID=A0A9D4Y395_PEA|nr:hypothetical protein KIW84_035937 [Pisum sativum]